MPPPPPTLPALLDGRLRQDPGRPLVTFYDDRTGERTELSTTTTATWVAKTAALLVEELDVEQGDRVAVDLPAHWLTPVWLLGAWSAGAAVVPLVGADPAPGDVRVVVCGPTRLAAHAGWAARSGAAVVALSLRPLGARFAEPLPAGVLDYGAVVWGQPDVYAPPVPPSADSGAWEPAEGPRLSHRDLLAAAAASAWARPGTRLLTDLAPLDRDGPTALVAPLLAGGGTVWVSGAEADAEAWDRRAATEAATLVHRTR